MALSEALPLPLPASKYALYPVASICDAQNLSIFADLSVPVRARNGFLYRNRGGRMCLGRPPWILQTLRIPRQARPSPRAPPSTRRQCQTSEAQQRDGPSHPCTSRTINRIPTRSSPNHYSTRPTRYSTRPPGQPRSPRPPRPFNVNHSLWTSTHPRGPSASISLCSRGRRCACPGLRVR